MERYACGASLSVPVAIIDLNKLEALPYNSTETTAMIMAAEALSSSLRAFLGKELFGPVGQPTSFFSRFIILSVKWHCDFTLQLKYLNPTDVNSPQAMHRSEPSQLTDSSFPSSVEAS